MPTACVTCVLLIGAFRAAWTPSPWSCSGSSAHAPVLLVGEGEGLSALQRVLPASRGALGYEFVGTFVPRGGEALAARIERDRPHEVILNEGDFDEQTVLEIVETAHRAGVGATRAADDGSARPARYVPGQGVPLFELRPPFVGADWVVKRSFDVLVGGVVVIVRTPLWLAIAAAIKLDSRARSSTATAESGSASRSSGCSRFRTMIEGCGAAG